MNRTLPALAAALFAATTFLAPAAQACISCEYTPEVVNTPVYSHGGYAKKRVYIAGKKQARPAKRQVVEIERKVRKIEAAKAETVKSEPVKAAAIEADPVELEVESENSAISTASVDKAETVEEAKEPKTVAKASGNVGCKKFFPTVGMTLTVPCE